MNTSDFINIVPYSPAQASSSEEPSLGLRSQGRGTVGSAPHIGQDDLSGPHGASASSLTGTTYLQNGTGFLSIKRWVFLGDSQAPQYSCSTVMSRKRRRPRPPQDPFIIISAETEKRRRNGPPQEFPSWWEFPKLSQALQLAMLLAQSLKRSLRRHHFPQRTIFSPKNAVYLQKKKLDPGSVVGGRFPKSRPRRLPHTVTSPLKNSWNL